MILTAGCQNKDGSISLRAKTWMIMKLTIAFLLFFTFQVSANGYAQKITIVKKNASLTEIFKAIERQTGFLFFYDKAVIQKAEVISKTSDLRDGKGSNARILRVLPQYTWVEVVRTEKKWLYVKTLRGELGWLNVNSVRLLGPLGRASSYVSSNRYDSQINYPTSYPDDIPGGKDLYEEVQRLKRRDGMTDREAVRKILREMGEIK